MKKKKQFIDDKPFDSKMIILTLIRKMGVPMPLSKIQAFILSTDFMDYYALSEYMEYLTEMGHLEYADDICGNEHTYNLTEKGIQAVEFFEERISQKAHDAITIFVENNKPQLSEKLSVFARYKTYAPGKYEVTCGVKENNEIVLEIKTYLTSRKYAHRMCEKWKDIYIGFYTDFIAKTLGVNTEQEQENKK